MKTAVVPGAKVPVMEFKKSLLESFGVNAKAKRERAHLALKASAATIEKLHERALEDLSAKVPNIRADVISFIGYLSGHDPHHRGQIAMLAREIGHPVPLKATSGLSEWDTLWKECGYGGGSTK